jgi:nucleotide-binding universal stress UspA family protein
MIPPARIVVCLQAGALSEPAVRYARTLAEHLGARLNVLYAVAEPLNADWTSEMSAAEIPRLQTGMEEEALERLARWIPADAQERLGLSLAIVTGALGDEIARHASAERPDLIVLGGREDQDRGDLAELAARVIRETDCAVLVAAR